MTCQGSHRCRVPGQRISSPSIAIISNPPLLRTVPLAKIAYCTKLNVVQFLGDQAVQLPWVWVDTMMKRHVSLTTTHSVSVQSLGEGEWVRYSCSVSSFVCTCAQHVVACFTGQSSWVHHTMQAGGLFNWSVVLGPPHYASSCGYCPTSIPRLLVHWVHPCGLCCCGEGREDSWDSWRKGCQTLSNFKRGELLCL